MQFVIASAKNQFTVSAPNLLARASTASLPQWDVSLVQDFEELFDASVLFPRCTGKVTELSLSLFGCRFELLEYEKRNRYCVYVPFLARVQRQRSQILGRLQRDENGQNVRRE